MINERYKIAISETLHYLKGIRQSDIDKIPNKFMNFLKNNKSENYICNFDYLKPLSELELMEESKGLIAMICLNYWCESDKQKNDFKKHLWENEIKYQEELLKKYNPDDLFKDKGAVEVADIQENTALIKHEEVKWYKKLFNTIKKYFVS